MTPPDTGPRAAVGVLAAAIGGLSISHDPLGQGIGADALRETDQGAEAEITVPSGDRFRITVTWLGDREGGS